MNQKKRFTADPVNSTFRWVFHFTPGMNSVKFMDGYSKGQGLENTNDRMLLMKKLQNPLLPKLGVCDKIEVFKNDFSIAKERHELVLELFPHEYAIYGEFQSDPFIIRFLNEFYTTYLETGKIAPPTAPEKQVSQKDLVKGGELSHAIKFNSHDQLFDFITRNERKYGTGFMKSWYWKHLEIQPELRVRGKKVSFKTGTLELITI